MQRPDVSRPRYHVRARLDENLDLRFRSYVYAGLLELARQRRIEFDFHFGPEESENVVNLEVRRMEDGAARALVFDCHDRSTVYCEKSLAAADRYFKRSFHPPDAAELPSALREKIVAWGPIFGTSASAWGYRQLALRFLQDSCRIRKDVASWKARKRNAWLYWNIRPYPCFEQPADHPRDPVILFQPRVWTDEDVTGSPSAREINEQRVGLLRLLRKTFRDRFIGGVVPTPLARKIYPDDLAETRTDKLSYFRLMNSSLITVNTLGLHRCIGWKFAEGLAGAMCIVSDPIRNQVPVPLSENNVLIFSENEQCLVHCERLLTDRDFARHMREANADYYAKYIVPPVNIFRSIESAFELA